MKCRVCDRQASSGKYCLSHQRALDNMIEKYDFWKKALSISWKEYLREIALNPLTGTFVQEVIQDLDKKGLDERNVEIS